MKRRIFFTSYDWKALIWRFRRTLPQKGTPLAGLNSANSYNSLLNLDDFLLYYPDFQIPSYLPATVRAGLNGFMKLIDEIARMNRKHSAGFYVYTP
ncbi:MAG TPA: hypothetical protein VGR03_03380 [Candidatus Acidoferrum sp.]|nr:hypothetical protein [Candidatus Acidoferrum sp.]